MSNPDPWNAPNYGAQPGLPKPLPAWLGEPHRYDFSRFNVGYWQRIDRAVQRMRQAGIVANCIVTIEKQDLPKEYGTLTDAEYRLYRYAIDRLAAFENVWWDLGNEHHKYRDVKWGNTMGERIKGLDPYHRLLSIHGNEEFLYSHSEWPDFIITQQYGDEKQVHAWALKYNSVAKPYVNEEYGYEGAGNRKKDQSSAPGHGQDRDWARRDAWSIAMAGGYVTYGDWSDGVSYYYMGRPGPGVAARQLKYLRSFFEELSFRDLVPHDELVTEGFCMATLPANFVIYLPRGGTTKLNLSAAQGLQLTARWFDPRTGQWTKGPSVLPRRVDVDAPSGGDWVLHIAGSRPSGKPGG